MIRIFSDILIFLLIFLLPPYIAIFLIFGATIIFSNFIESIVFGLLIDLLYGGGNVFGFNFVYLFTLVSVIFYIFSFRLKTILRLSF